MYRDVSTMDRILNLSWDLFVIVLLLIAIIYIFGNLVISTGIPQFYIENYVYALFCSIIGYQALFSIIFYSGIRKTIYLFGFPVIDLNSLGYEHFLNKISTYTSSSTFILFFLFIMTIPFLVLFIRHFRTEVELRYNKVLIKPYLYTLIFVMIISISSLLFNASF